ncbi:YfcL family protein [Enterobacteriaceae bacterium ESL0689]|nr:YfcL family protein [Enterobacteriaceae bacterium ESL0689]
MPARFESRLLTLMDEMIDATSDDQRFASSYLHGHLSLAIADLENQQDVSPQMIQDRVMDSLTQAFRAGELSPPDQILVRNMWAALCQQAS